MNYALVCVAYAIATVSDEYSSVVVAVGLSIPVILSCFMLEELFCQNFPKGRLFVLLELAALCKKWSLLKMVLV